MVDYKQRIPDISCQLVLQHCCVVSCSMKLHVLLPLVKFVAQTNFHVVQVAAKCLEKLRLMSTTTPGLKFWISLTFQNVHIYI